MVGRNILEHPAAADYEFLSPSSSKLDLTQRHLIDKFLAENSPDLIIHCAGIVGGIQANISRPVEFLTSNTQAGINLLLAARDAGIKQFLNLASSCMYPRFAENPLSEDQLLTGELEPTNEGYALAKLVSTRLCEYIVREKPDLTYRTLIPCNLYGRYDHFDENRSHLIPAIIKKIYDAVKSRSPVVEIWGDGTARREFMYAGDLADFIFYVIPRLENMQQNTNVGLGHDFTITEYYHAVAGEIGFDGEFNYDVSKPSGMKQKLVDTAKQSSLGWSPKTSLSEGISLTYQYFIGE